MEMKRNKDCPCECTIISNRSNYSAKKLKISKNLQIYVQSFPSHLKVNDQLFCTPPTPRPYLFTILAPQCFILIEVLPTKINVVIYLHSTIYNDAESAVIKYDNAICTQCNHNINPTKTYQLGAPSSIVDFVTEGWRLGRRGHLRK